MSQNIIEKFILDVPCSVIENSGQNLFNGHRYNSITLIDENIKVANTISSVIFLFIKRKALTSLGVVKFIFLNEIKNNKCPSFEAMGL